VAAAIRCDRGKHDVQVPTGQPVQGRIGGTTGDDEGPGSIVHAVPVLGAGYVAEGVLVEPDRVGEAAQVVEPRLGQPGVHARPDSTAE